MNKLLSIFNHYGQYRFELNIENPEFMTFQIGSEHFTMIVLKGDTFEMNFNKTDIKKTISLSIRLKISFK